MEVPGPAGLDGVSFLVEDLRLITGHGFARRSRLERVGEFDTKMCSISVEPMPSRMTESNVSFQRRQTRAGNASAAETHNRIEERS